MFHDLIQYYLMDKSKSMIDRHTVNRVVNEKATLDARRSYEERAHNETRNNTREKK